MGIVQILLAETVGDEDGAGLEIADRRVEPRRYRIVRRNVEMNEIAVFGLDLVDAALFADAADQLNLAARSRADQVRRLDEKRPGDLLQPVHGDRHIGGFQPLHGLRRGFDLVGKLLEGHAPQLAEFSYSGLHLALSYYFFTVDEIFF